LKLHGTLSFPFSSGSLLSRPTAGVTCVWAGVDSVWEQEKPEARKMLENAAESHTSGARCVRRLYERKTR